MTASTNPPRPVENRALVHGIGVENGTITDMRSSCANCAKILSDKQISWVTEGRKLRAAIHFPIPLFHSVRGPNGLRSIPYCGSCIEHIRADLDLSPRIEREDQEYDSVRCAKCGVRGPMESYTAYVLDFSHWKKRGVDGATLSPVYVKGDSYRCLCPNCKTIFKEERVNIVDGDRIKERVSDDG